VGLDVRHHRLDRESPDAGRGPFELPPTFAEQRLVGVPIEMGDDAVGPACLTPSWFILRVEAARPANRVTGFGAEPRRSPKVRPKDDEVASAAGSSERP
jgi:hypothetical protein